MPRITLLALTLLAACAQVPKFESPVPAVKPTTGRAALVVTVDRAGTSSSSRPKLWLRRTGADEPALRARVGDFDGGSEPVRFEGLAPGSYELACTLSFELNGPWITVHHRVSIQVGAETSVPLAVPTGNAQLRIVPEPHSPPYLLVLSDPDVQWPADHRELVELLREERYPTGIHFALLKDGSPHRRPLPLLPEGDYRAMVVANDWEPGDPPILPRTVAISLREGKTTNLNLDGKLTRLSVN